MTDNMPDISAEVLLELLYPELCDKIVVKSEGTFTRGYSRDLLSFDPATFEATLSRDGFIKTLPQGLLTSESELKSGEFSDKHNKLKRRVRLLGDVFAPIDSFVFRQRLQTERKVSDLLEGRIDFILKNYFGVDRGKIESDYVRELATLLPFVSRLRAHLPFIKSIVSSITGYETELVTGRYSSRGNTRKWRPLVRVNVLVPNLPHDEYLALSKKLEPLEDFLREWFVPVEAYFALEVKHHGASQSIDEHLMLDYNVELA